MYVLRLKRRTNLLKVSLIAVAAILAACLLALEVRVQPSQAAFPGQNGKIAFSTNRDGHVQQSGGDSWPSAEIYVMDADGSNALNITNDPLSHDFSPTYSPDGTKLAFGSYRDVGRNPERIYIMNADGSGVRHASEASEAFSVSTWSPDSSKLAFSRHWYDNGFENDIWVMNADGSGQTNITADLGFYWELEPTWSPDGSKIAFTGHPTDEGDYGDIYVMDADGSNITSLTNDRDIPDGHPQWSPDGTKIMFGRRVQSSGPPPWHGSNYDIYVMDANGSDMTALTRYPGSDGSAKWSPDGSKIAFERYRFVDGSLTDDIYVMNADGSNKIKVSPEGHYAFDPQWSPDGSKIVFTSHREGEVDQFGNRALEIYTVNADGSNLTNISNNPASDSGADWQPLSVPTTKADCKDGGYEAFGFKNHGECIASVNRAAKSE